MGWRSQPTAVVNLDKVCGHKGHKPGALGAWVLIILLVGFEALRL